MLFRNDLRVGDNGALSAAVNTGKPVLAAYILDEESERTRPLGDASRWWLHHSLAAVAGKLERLGARLVLRRGATGTVMEDLLAETGTDTVLWNRRYDPGGIAADTTLKQILRERGLQAESFDGHLLHEPSRLLTGSGSFYKVFTPFWSALARDTEPRDPVDAPKRLDGFSGEVASESLDDLLPLPTSPDWAGGLRECWTPGEDGAQARLEEFLSGRLEDYSDGRDFPGRPSTSRLSPHLAHGEITPYQIFAALRERGREAGRADIAKFRKEIGWREFCYHLLFHNPHIHEKNFQPGFDAFPWRSDDEALDVWRRGQTGYPIVDAGMRELWRTGTMHNRVRMIAASFLTKHLLIDWREGERWFWDTLVDADPASNPGNWQWVAGCGADAAPYFRIFNPVLQGEKFDPDGTYVRRWVPELDGLPARYLHKPWDAPGEMLERAGVTLGETYPHPVVHHTSARERALAAYRMMRGDA
ncbi:deoxyribodipyrimidine photo-lyase [Mesorhizobium sp. J428]|uniref:cryptochrome/photolyase family protein n=1 Tax=Mesorhizobium sp. J428 TaxID=2898440 RepID=UPI0021511F07|nr:deoxyribodipyrimidine photo-lyase [Mesorhizobium sp. J428]MCR5856414.1 DNA photolyase family protein [Mesorhizobium sp. J428]